MAAVIIRSGVCRHASRRAPIRWGRETPMVTTTDVIERVLIDADAYNAAVKSEGEAWGEQFGSERTKRIRAEDEEATLQLRPSRQGRDFAALARENGWHFSLGLSLGCGAGIAERELLDQILFERNILSPVGGQYVMRKRA
jgi:hypothetical protein